MGACCLDHREADTLCADADAGAKLMKEERSVRPLLSIPARPRVFRERCLRAIGVDPAGVRVQLDASLRGSGCWALAQHSVIRLAPAALVLPERALHELLGHELCHVAQQRCCDLTAAHDEVTLEAQAERWGAALRDGVPAADRVALRGASSIARAAVWVAGQRVRRPDDLDRPIEAALALIPRAAGWLDYAASDASVELTFPDGPSFLVSVLRGLYATDLMFLRRIKAFIGPRCLLELGSETIDQILAYEIDEAGSASPDALLSVFKKRSILTASEIAAAFATLSQAGADDEAVFQIRTLDEAIRLHRALSCPGVFDPPSEVAKAAVSFALERASTISEFADAMGVFLSVAQASSLIGQPAEQAAGNGASIETVQAQAAMFWEMLYDACSAWLFTPAFAFPVTNTDELAILLRQHIEFGQPLGFQSPSSGARQVMAYLAEHNMLRSMTLQVARDYLHRVQACVVDGVIADFAFRQDGLAQRFIARSAAGTARLSIDATGCVTVDSYEAARRS